jgi:hypothetical protein
LLPGVITAYYNSQFDLFIGYKGKRMRDVVWVVVLRVNPYPTVHSN